MDIFEESIEMHKELGGKIETKLKCRVQNKKDLSLAYTPGVAGVCQEIAKNPARVHDLTIKKNTVAIITDGSAVLGLGNIGPEAALPVMEGKALLFKEYADIDAFPICLSTQNTDEIIQTIKNILPVFAGINLEDISAPRCFEIENALSDIGIPVFHDDQHGTAIVTVAALINSLSQTNKQSSALKIVINGAGAAGSAITDLLQNMKYKNTHLSIKEIIICDSVGILSKGRTDIQDKPSKLNLSQKTNPNNITGGLSAAIKNADVFIGVSVGNAVSKEMIRSMAKDPIIFAMANPIPEIMPEDAKEAGAFIVGTGRSDLPNQINNVLAFPGIFRGALNCNATQITDRMKQAATYALAKAVETPTPDHILPSVFDKSVAHKIADEVMASYQKEAVR